MSDSIGPISYALNVYRGDSAAWLFILWNDAAQTEPIDLTGATVAAEIRSKPGLDPAITLDCAVTLPNTIDVTLAPANSALLPIVGVWDLQVTDASGNVTTYVAGPVLVTPDVTGSAA